MIYAFVRMVNGEPAEYPIFEGDLRLRFAQMDPPVILATGEYLEAPEDYAIVVDVPPPAVTFDQDVEDAQWPELADGFWRRAWIVGDVTAEVVAERFAALQATKCKAIDARLREAFLAGYTPASGPLAGHTLQCRNNEDRTNWLTSQASYMAAVQGGFGATEGANFRTAANETVTLTYADGLEVLVAGMAGWGQSIMANSWALKDAVNAAVDVAALDAIDIEANWP